MGVPKLQLYYMDDAMNPDGTYNFTVVNDTDGTFRVHRSGCADILRRRRMNGCWDRQAKDADEVVRLEREDLRRDFGNEADDFEFVILPCTVYIRKYQGEPVK